MSAPNLAAETERWIAYADEDLRAARAMLLIADGVPRIACWLAQQAVEKAIKAVLVYLQIPYHRRHDLEALRLLVPTGWSLCEDESDLDSLTQWAVEADLPAHGYRPPAQ